MADTAQLTEEEKEAIRTSWEVIYENKKQNGVAFFRRLFTEVPEAKALFKNLLGMEDMDKMLKNPRLKAHGARLMSSLNSLIEYIDDWDILAQVLSDLGRSHAKNKVPTKYFEELEPILVWFVKTKSGKAYSDFVEASWIKLWNAMYPHIVQGIKEASKPAKTRKIKKK